jgi:Cu(I)/Ag(I) efflux system membrane fusion protein
VEKREEIMSTERLPGPSYDAPRTRWQKIRLVIKVVELRLRFIALMGLTALTFAYWDEIANRIDKWSRPETSQHAQVSGIEYFCPMHPQVIQEEPGSCPICGMPLARRKAGEKTPLPPGVTARVELAPFRVEQAGIRTVPVAYKPLTQTVTTVGYVTFDERKMANIIAKVPGRTRVEKLFVNFTGQDVAVGQILAELYSPELSQGVQELLNVSRRAENSRSPRTAIGRSLVADRADMVRAAEEKLRLWGLTQAQIDDIEKNGRSDVTIPILSRIEGHVFKKNVVEGQEVPAGFVLFEVADLRTVWVQAQVYEQQLGAIHVGQPVEATVEAFPGETFSGKVEFIQPHLDPTTRTVDVRYGLDNPGHRLRPGMFATVQLKTSVADTPLFQTRKTSAHSHASPEPQTLCPVTDAVLGSMGDPVAVDVEGRKILTCCDACPPKVKASPKVYLAKLAKPAAAEPSPEEQKICPVTGAKLGSMGDPILVEVDGRKVWTCCKACPPKLKADPAKYLARLAPPPSNEVLSVPESAVIDTGTRKVVYVETKPGVFEGREVTLGPRMGNFFPVLKGLAPGDSVAASGAFLIDAESRLNPGTAPAAESPALSDPEMTTGKRVHQH